VDSLARHAYRETKRGDSGCRIFQTKFVTSKLIVFDIEKQCMNEIFCNPMLLGFIDTIAAKDQLTRCQPVQNGVNCFNL
jgi:hypothetical protein